MLDLWNMPEAASLADIITARVALGIRYGMNFVYHTGAQREVARKNICSDLGINRSTLQAYLNPVFNDKFQLVSGPSKLAVFHGIIFKVGLLPSQIYDAAERAENINDYLGEVSRLFVNIQGSALPAGLLKRSHPAGDQSLSA